MRPNIRPTSRIATSWTSSCVLDGVVEYWNWTPLNMMLALTYWTCPVVVVQLYQVDAMYMLLPCCAHVCASLAKNTMIAPVSMFPGRFHVVDVVSPPSTICRFPQVVAPQAENASAMACRAAVPPTLASDAELILNVTVWFGQCVNDRSC